MSKTITTLLISALLSTGCAEQSTELNDTAAFDTGDTAAEEITDWPDTSNEEDGPDGFIQKKPTHFDVDDLQLHPISEEPLDELNPL